MKERKDYILKNVGRLYLKHGIRAITMDMVAAEFGISKKTLYQFFKDKKDLIDQVINYYLDRSVLDQSMECPGNAIDRILNMRKHLSQLMKQFNNNLEFDLKKSYPGLYEKVHELKRKSIFEHTVKNISDGIESGLFRAELDTEFIAKLQVGRMLYTMNPDNEIFDISETTSPVYFDKVIDYHMHAICTEKGLEYYKKRLNNIQNEENN